MSCDCENKKTPETIPYVVHEAIVDKLDRDHKNYIEKTEEAHTLEIMRSENHCKKWMIAFFVAICLFFVTNIGWIIYESQFETISYTQDGQGFNNINVGEQGDLNNGTNGQNQTETQE